MSLFVEVFSMEKQVPIIINLEKVVEIAPWKAGGCKLFFDDFVGGKQEGMLVKEDYSYFQPYAVSMVSQVTIQNKIDSLKWSAPATGNVTLEGSIEETKKGPGRPKKEA